MQIQFRACGISPRSMRFALPVLLAATFSLLATFYIDHERFIYFWDWNGFIGITREFCDALRQGPSKAFNLFWGSLRNEYNLIFAVPLSAVFVWDSTSRALYIAAIAALYLTGTCVSAGYLMRRAFPQYGDVGLWCASWLTALIPPAWLATMRGYPDTFGVIFIFLALAVLLGDLTLERRRNIVKIALCLAFAIAIRRHLAYAAIAVIATFTCVLGTTTFAQRTNDFAAWTAKLAHIALRPTLLGLATLIALAAINPFFILNVLHNDYGSLYASYALTPEKSLEYIGHTILGVPFFLLGLVGCMLGVITRLKRPDAGFAISVFPLLWLAIWICIARQTSPQQLIVGLPLLVITGAFNVLMYAQRIFTNRVTKLFVSIFGFYALATATLSFGPTPSAWRVVDSYGHFLPVYSGPLRRNDISTIRNLLAALREGPQPLFVAASSSKLNFDIVAQSEAQFFPQNQRKLAVVQSAQIDSRDPLPIEDLLRANQIVTATPWQHHIAPDQQQVVKSVVDLIEHESISGDFKQLQQFYILDDGIKTAIYIRIRPTSITTALETLRLLRARVPATNKLFQDYWYIGDQSVPFGLDWNSDGSRNAYMDIGQKSVVLTLLRETNHAVDWSAKIRVVGGQCKAATVTVGNESRSFPSVLVDTGIPWQVHAKPDAQGLIQVRVQSNDGSPCNVAILEMHAAPQ